jgi:serralysin
LLTLYNSNGDAIWNNGVTNVVINNITQGSKPTHNSFISQTAGDYFLSVSDAPGKLANYSVTAIAPVDSYFINALDGGIKWETTTGTRNINYSFDTINRDPAKISGFQTYSPNDQQAIRAALDEYEAIAPLKFVPSNGADIQIEFGTQLWLDDNSIPTKIGGVEQSFWFTNKTQLVDGNQHKVFSKAIVDINSLHTGTYNVAANTPYTTTAYANYTSYQLATNNTTTPPSLYAPYTTLDANGNKVFVNTGDNTTYLYGTFLHEIGHELGMKHPHNDGDIILPTTEDKATTEDKGSNTVMTYNLPYPQHLSMFDVATIQYLYGVNTTVRAEDNIYTNIFNNKTDPFSHYFWDGNGRDTLDASDQTSKVTINLKPGSWIYAGSKTHSITDDNQAFIGYGTTIEKANGGSGGDSITGNDAVNTLQGNGGDDTLDGGSNVDMAVYNGNYDRFSVSKIPTGGISVKDKFGTNGTDTLTNIEWIKFDDKTIDSSTIRLLSLAGDSTDNTLPSASTDELIDGGAGIDIAVFSGTLSNASISYSSYSNAFGVATTNGGADTVVNVETFKFDDQSVSASNTVSANDFDAAFYLAKYIDLRNAFGTDKTAAVAHFIQYGYGEGRTDSNSGDDVLNGSSLADSINAGAGNDTLDGGFSADTMNGGIGNDTYIIDNASDIIAETSTLATEIDTVNSSISYTLPANVENLTLTGTAKVNSTGNAQNNTLLGNSAANTLNGNRGMDIMDGGDGNDIYVVDNINDIVVEQYGDAIAGIDTVRASVSYTLSDYIENLTLTGTTAINGTGNTLNNVLTGNVKSNFLKGDAGNDILIGGLGKDNLTGGLGADKFKFAAVTETGITATTRDTITDFKTAQADKIDLSAIDANTALVGNQVFSFIGTATFSANAVGQLRFDAVSHLVYGSNDADIAPEFSILLTGVTSLTATDFIL